MRKALLIVASVGALAAAPAATVAARPAVSLKAGVTVTIEGQDCGQTAFKKVTTTKTVANGVFSVAVKPTINTTYRATIKGATSPNAAVTVRPLVVLKKVAAGRFSATVSAAQSFAGKYVLFQRKGATRWTTVKKVVLKVSTGVSPPTMNTSATFRARIKARLRVRALLIQSQAGTCYAAASSKSIRS